MTFTIKGTKKLKKENVSNSELVIKSYELHMYSSAEYCTFLVENTPKSIKLRVTCTKGTLRELHAPLPLLYGLLRTLRHAQYCENNSEFENLGLQISPLARLFTRP